MVCELTNFNYKALDVTEIENVNGPKNYRWRQRIENIAGRLPENSRNSFVDLQSQKTVKKTDQKIVFSLKADMLYFD